MTFDLALALDLLGVFFFAVSGSLLAARKGFDLVGSLLLGSMVGLGGGVVRDVIINNGVPAAFSNPIYLVPALVAAMVVYLLPRGVERTGRLLLVFDAGGLALFCITGTLKALGAGLNPVAAILLGVTTAVGGGILRDITANEVPRLFDPTDLYAIPAFLGAGLTTLLFHLDALNLATGSAVAAAVFAFRVLSLKFGWHAPLAARSWRVPRRTGHSVGHG
ncbi:trimeric intracellular cation channel family protein [Arthrobacter sp. 35W]|uniref:trimeric intracellular cation channel family protein n=1 Tax=Arthrobacter sp. 35W TaxID=1132441 RepID=UPI0004112CE5|nr:trimeric intracellular cation channel family protein [Arthrobacter sp. 35W]